jgi:hypothetical protein
MKIMSKITMIALLMVGIAFNSTAQDQGFIYGKITTIDNETYTGQLRWGKEEAFWADQFNGTKGENEAYDYLSRDDRNRLRDRERNNGWRSFNTNWNSRRSYDVTHEFRIRFGNISKLEINRRSEVELTLRNGETIFIEDGSNDFGGQIVIMDAELGKMSFKWSRIDNIEFMATPSSLEAKLGDPLYGTVTTYAGEFTGYVQWDHDERISTDILDGESRDGNLDIEFGNIKSIERDRSGATVITKSGRELYMRGTNDVNSGNRGIIVNTDFGRVDIPWREFKKVEFSETTGPALSYNDFDSPKKVSGTVLTMKGESISGSLIYDLDEEYDFEMIQGDDDDIEYFIPLKYISKIIPKNYDNSTIVLKSGKEITLGGSRDVSEDNDGVVVLKGSGNDSQYIFWEDIKEITFNN